MNTFSTFLSILCVVQLTAATEYPSDLERCHAGDTVCLVKVLNLYLHLLGNGRSDLNIVPLDPLLIEELNIVQGGDSLNMNLNLKDSLLYGLSNGHVIRVVGFGKDPSTSKFEIYSKIERMTLVGNYSATGYVFILPISGSGPVNITLTNVNAAIKLIPKVEIKGGKKYLRISDLKFNFKAKGFHMQFSALLDRFINDNSSAILNELRPALKKALAEVFMKVMSPLFAKFPYQDLFL